MRVLSILFLLAMISLVPATFAYLAVSHAKVKIGIICTTYPEFHKCRR